ncbi:hypothetical protein DFH27DRAFT_207755 [Peziza echinospora]|nr:hypothetical protein DFH27DRAFT_207755 [Peziza echinospora]
MKPSFFNFVPFALAFLIPAVISAPAPISARLSSRDHTLSDSKRIPILNSGNALITSKYNIIYRQDRADIPFTKEEKVAQGNDINRGFQKLEVNATAETVVEWGTIQVIQMPPEAEGKMCRIHFFMGAGDGTSGVARVHIFKLVDGPFGEFTTTFNNRPSRVEHLGTFSVSPPEWVRELYSRPSLTTTGPNGENYNEAGIVEYGIGDRAQQINIPCPPPGVEVPFDVAPVQSRDDGGMALMAYSMNKGVSLEILGVPRESVVPWDHSA